MPSTTAAVIGGQRFNSQRVRTRLSKMSEWFFLGPTEYCLVSGRSHAPRKKHKKSRPGRSALYSAAEHGRVTRVMFLLALGRNPDRADTYGITPLQIAAWNNHCKIVQKLTKHGSNVNIADRVGHTALFKAVWKGCQGCVQCLLEAGASGNTQDHSGNTPLMLAAELGMEDLAGLILAHGAKLGVRNRWGESALYIAVAHDNVFCVRLLLEAGANPNQQTYDGCSPLFNAASRRSYYSHESSLVPLKMLIGSNADFDLKGRDPDILSGKMISAFEASVQVGNLHAATLLERCGCDTAAVYQWLRQARALPDALQDNKRWLEYIQNAAQSPRTLTQLCRNRIRRSVREAYQFDDLKLPTCLLNYVKLKDELLQAETYKII